MNVEARPRRRLTLRNATVMRSYDVTTLVTCRSGRSVTASDEQRWLTAGGDILRRSTQNKSEDLISRDRDNANPALATEIKCNCQFRTLGAGCHPSVGSYVGIRGSTAASTNREFSSGSFCVPPERLGSTSHGLSPASVVAKPEQKASKYHFHPVRICG